MLICRDCFADVELRSEVESNATIQGVCEVCSSRGKLIDSSEFCGFFVTLLSLYEPSITGKPVAEIIQKDWHLFADVHVAEVLLSEAMKDSALDFAISDNVDYSKEIKERVGIWRRLKKSVKHESRFFTSMDEFAEYEYLKPSMSLYAGRTWLYRSRITPSGKRKLNAKDMYCPPTAMATAGRANPVGIPYLYLSDSAKTTYYEVRAVYLDRLSVGKFEIINDLSLIDFRFELNLWLEYVDSPGRLADSVIKKMVINEISGDLSKPLRRYDSEVEYVPTQLICEFCKETLQVDGLCFGSSLYKGGLNYVLFDQNSVRCIRVESHEITTIDIDR